MKKNKLPENNQSSPRVGSGIEKREISDELQESYLDYAMSVIVSRALPDVRDGLKPVQRRILWAMWESGLRASAKHRKSASVIGDTLKSYHPHGDISVYDALVRMAQDFSLRYPLIDGQGNFGSQDGDSAAAYRYTECRLSKIAEELLVDIEKDTVNWLDNYDGTTKEPAVLPSKLPHLLLNGSSGIAVGMATSIPPHNLSEVIDATLHLIDSPKATIEDLLKFIQGPDFPTGGIIYDKKSIAEAYSTGRGSIPVRAVAEIEERKKDNFNIIITEIPYQVNKSELLIKMAGLVTDKKIQGIKDLRDESDRDGLRIVVELKNDVPAQKILNQLYKHTDLQKNFNLNTIALVGGLQPQLLSLKEFLAQYIEHRKEVVRRRAEFELRKAKERAHILEGLAKALSVIDKVIETIKKSKDKEEARKNLVSRFKLTEIQAEAILEMKLSTLAALERQKIEDELKEKRKLINELEILLNSSQKILKVIKDELSEIKKNYGDERRTKIVAGGLTEFKEEDLITEEEVVITLSQNGYIKRGSPDVFRSQQRGGKGLIASEVGEEDALTHFIAANSHDNILFFTERGRVFQTKVYEIPSASRQAKGKVIQNFLEIPPDEKVSAVVAYAPTKNQQPPTHNYLVMATKNGVIKKTPLLEFANIRRTGIIGINLQKGDVLNWVMSSSGKDEVLIVTALGQSIRFKESQLRSMSRIATGVKAIKLKKAAPRSEQGSATGDDFVVGLDIISTESKEKISKLKVLIVTENGFSKQTSLGQYKVQKRSGKGIKTAKITSKTGRIVSAQVIFEATELLAISSKGQIIKTPLKKIRTAGRATSGVKIMTLKGGDKLVGAVTL
ncbi:MAG: DNA gyrase subunit A [Candidatus Wolfebacteria bacterium]|nr:DNA gyrase subunit A [Candidatus Wolfebacteria bacterium]